MLVGPCPRKPPETHMLPSTLRLAAALALPSAGVTAQVRPGVFGSQGTSPAGTAGEFCFTFDCTPRPLTCTAGDTLTLRVNAPFQNLYVIGASLTATSCTPVPPLSNALVI